MFMGDDNYASAESHRMGFWQDVIRPRARLFEEAFNGQLLEKLGLRMEFAFDEMDISRLTKRSVQNLLVNLF